MKKSFGLSEEREMGGDNCVQEAGRVVQFVGESKKGQWEGQAEAVDRNSPALRVSCELMCGFEQVLSSVNGNDSYHAALC